MSRRKKLLVFSLLTLVVLVVIGYFTVNLVLEGVSRRAMGQLVGLAGQQGIEVVEPSFESVGLSGLIAVTWAELQAGLKFSKVEAVSSERLWRTEVGRVRVNWRISGQSTLAIDRLVMDANSSDDATKSSSDRRIELEDVRYQFGMELFDPKATLGRLLPEIGRLSSTAETSFPLELTGKLSFVLKGEPAVVGILIQQKEGVYSIRLDPQDVAPLSSRFDEKLTQAEIDLVAGHPLRAIRLLRIKDRAETVSERAHQQDSGVPQDAYRHILWSFLLAKEYGAEFAEQVGDAHETGDTGNTAAEREMDLHNNAIGRQYAELVEEKGVLQRLLDDQNVVREP